MVVLTLMVLSHFSLAGSDGPHYPRGKSKLVFASQGDGGAFLREIDSYNKERQSHLNQELAPDAFGATLVDTASSANAHEAVERFSSLATRDPGAAFKIFTTKNAALAPFKENLFRMNSPGHRSFRRTLLALSYVRQHHTDHFDAGNISEKASLLDAFDGQISEQLTLGLINLNQSEWANALDDIQAVEDELSKRFRYRLNKSVFRALNARCRSSLAQTDSQSYVPLSP